MHDILVQRPFFAFVRFFFSQTGLKAYVALGLEILLSLLGGISLLMLIPFLYTVGLEEANRQSEIMVLTMEALQSLGVTLNLAVGLVGFVGLITLQALIKYYQSILNTEIVERFGQRLRNQLYEAMTRADWLCIVRMRTSDINHTISGEVGRINGIARSQLSLFGDLFVAVVNISLALYLSVVATILALASAGALFFMLRPLDIHVKASGEALQNGWKCIYATITDHLAGIKVSKSLGLEEKHIQHFCRVGVEAVSQTVNFSRITSRGQLLQHVGMAITLSAFIYVGAEIASVPVAELILLIFIFSRLLPKFTSMLASWHSIQHGMPSFHAYRSMYACFEECREGLLTQHDKPLPLDRGIRLENVSFYYDSKGSPTLDRVNLVIPARSMTGIVGPSGAGKSTLADILIGLLRPQEGRILIGDQALTRERLSSWRHSVGYVPQEPFLFHDTVRANVLWGKPNASEEELWWALKSAAATFVDRLPEGLNTVVGDRGIRLSGGERQRIVLARALIREPALLMLDEATSALDAENERRIQEAIDRLHGELTLVVIAHRLSTIRKADQIIVLDHGQVVEWGTWMDLVNRPYGIFRSIVEADDRSSQDRNGVGWKIN